MAETFQLTLYPLGRPPVFLEAAAVRIETQEAQMGFLPRHAPLLAPLAAGFLEVETPTGKKTYFIVSGLVRMLADRCEVISPFITEAPETIRKDLQETQDALQSQQTLWAQKNAPAAAAFIEKELHLYRQASAALS